jgi:hypothetical protein
MADRSKEVGADLTDSEGAYDPDRLLARVAVVPLLTLESEPAMLREHFRASPVVIGFVRHFGCLFCHQMVDELIAHVSDVQRRGARVVIVGNGSVHQAQRFSSAKNLPREGVVVLTDPGREAFRAAGFERGLGRTLLHPGAWSAYISAKAQGHTGTGLFGDLTQLGGILVVRPPATLAYLHRSRFAGDHPEMRDVLAALPMA